MRLPITVLAGLLLSATLVGCSGSAAIPKPPSDAKDSPPPGTSADMTKVKQAGGGGLGPASPLK